MPKMPGVSGSPRNLYLLFAILIAGTVFAATCRPLGAADKGGGDNVSAKRGETIFHQRCAVCHNKQPNDQSPFGPPNLFGVFRQKQLTVPQAATIIRHGKNQMPAFGSTISGAEIRDVIAYLSRQ